MVCVVGQIIVGAIGSVRVTLKEQVAVFPLPSFAVSVTVVLPTPETVLPGAGSCVEAGGAAQLSDMVAGL